MLLLDILLFKFNLLPLFYHNILEKSRFISSFVLTLFIKVANNCKWLDAHILQFNVFEEFKLLINLLTIFRRSIRIQSSSIMPGRMGLPTLFCSIMRFVIILRCFISYVVSLRGGLAFTKLIHEYAIRAIHRYRPPLRVLIVIMNLGGLWSIFKHKFSFIEILD